jgi:hypothetical protein
MSWAAGIPVKVRQKKRRRLERQLDDRQSSPNMDCAMIHRYMMSAKGQCGVSTVTGCSATNPVARPA